MAFDCLTSFCTLNLPIFIECCNCAIKYPSSVCKVLELFIVAWVGASCCEIEKVVLVVVVPAAVLKVAVLLVVLIIEMLVTTATRTVTLEPVVTVVEVAVVVEAATAVAEAPLTQSATGSAPFIILVR